MASEFRQIILATSCCRMCSAAREELSRSKQIVSIDRLLGIIHFVRVFVGLLKKPAVSVKHVGTRSVTISLTPPVDAPASVVITYLITYGKTGKPRTMTTTKTSVTLSNLEKNTEYQIAVRAKYTGGKYGHESDPLKVTTNSGS